MQKVSGISGFTGQKRSQMEYWRVSTFGIQGNKSDTNSQQTKHNENRERVTEREWEKTIKTTKQFDSDRVQQRYKLNKKEAAFQFSQKLPAI